MHAGDDEEPTDVCTARHLPVATSSGGSSSSQVHVDADATNEDPELSFSPTRTHAEDLEPEADPTDHANDTNT